MQRVADAALAKRQEDKGVRLSKGWWDRFLERFKELSDWGILEPMGSAKSDLEEEKNSFSRKVRCIFRKYKMEGEWNRIYNVDTVWQFSGNDAATLTMCICADGSSQQPMVTFQGAKADFPDDESDGVVCASTASGNLGKEVFLEYLQHLEPHFRSRRPVFVICAKKSGLISDDLLNFCLEKEIWLLNIPRKKLSLLAQPFDSLVPDLTPLLDPSETNAQSAGHNIPTVVRRALAQLSPERIKMAFQTSGFLQCGNQPETERGIGIEKTRDLEQDAEELGACALCSVRLGVSHVECVLCRRLYHEACAGKEKGESTVVCVLCRSA